MGSTGQAKPAVNPHEPLRVSRGDSVGGLDFDGGYLLSKGPGVHEIEAAPKRLHDRVQDVLAEVAGAVDRLAAGGQPGVLTQPVPVHVLVVG